MPEEKALGGGIKLKPMAASQTIKKYDGVSFRVSFDRGCPTSMWAGSIGMHFVDINGIVLLTVGEHSVGTTSNHSKFLGLLRVLEILIQQKWHMHGDYVFISGDSQFVIKVVTWEWDALKLHLLEVYE